MKGTKILALILIVGGVLVMIYGGFSYTKRTSEAKIGSLDLTVQHKERVNVPLWAGIGAVIAGGALLLADEAATPPAAVIA